MLVISSPLRKCFLASRGRFSALFFLRSNFGTDQREEQGGGNSSRVAEWPSNHVCHIREGPYQERVMLPMRRTLHSLERTLPQPPPPPKPQRPQPEEGQKGGFHFRSERTNERVNFGGGGDHCCRRGQRRKHRQCRVDSCVIGDLCYAFSSSPSVRLGVSHTLMEVGFSAVRRMNKEMDSEGTVGEGGQWPDPITVPARPFEGKHTWPAAVAASAEKSARPPIRKSPPLPSILIYGFKVEKGMTTTTMMLLA